tara:strand:+ start:491 stop:1195 length:705 start_codon:yes stop_codon:yes gene_type:complete
MNRGESGDINSTQPYNFISMLNSIMQNSNIILRDEISNMNNTIAENLGCSEEFKNNLEECIVDNEFIKTKKQCSICLDEFKLGDKYIRLPCHGEGNESEDNHVFHSDCDTCSGIKPWLERNNTCPMCRKEFPRDNQPILSGSGRTSDIFESITIHTNMASPIVNIPHTLNMPMNNTDSDSIPNQTIENIIPNPNDLENTISNIITNYINEIEESNEQRDIQLAIEASLQNVDVD